MIVIGKTDKVYLRNPVGVNFSEAFACTDTFWGLKGTNEDTVGFEEILNGSSLCKELRVGEDIETAVRLRVGFEDSAHGLGSTARDGGFLNYDLGAGGNVGDVTGSEFDVATRKNFMVSGRFLYKPSREKQKEVAYRRIY